MKVNSVVLIALVCLISFPSSAVPHIDDEEGHDLSQEDSVASNRMNSGSIQKRSLGLMSGFIENRGQLDNGSIRYYSLLVNEKIAFVDGGVLMNIEEPRGKCSHWDVPLREQLRGVPKDMWCSKGYSINVGCSVRFEFEGAANVNPKGRDKLPGNSNFFLGDDPTGWHTGVPSFNEIIYEDLYQGIDLVYRLDPSGLKYEFILAPGTNPTVIKIRVMGHDTLDIENDNILISTAIGEIVDTGILAYYDDSPSVRIECSFEPRGKNTYGFQLPGLDKGKTLVIDPLVYSTYLGAAQDDQCESITVDDDGDSVVSGSTWSVQFPTTPGSYDTDHDGSDSDGFVAKQASNGTSLIWSTFIGGSQGDSISDLFIDSVGNIYMGGITFSDDFPTSPGALQNQSCGGASEGVICKLRSDGAELLYSTYLGGEDLDYLDNIFVDDTGSAYLCGHIDYRFSRTTGQNPSIGVSGTSDGHYQSSIESNSSFPTTFGAYCTTAPGGDYDGFVCKINPTGTKLVYSTYLGGNDIDIVSSMVVDGTGCVYACGGTNSFDFPHTPRAFQRSPSGYMDGFVTKISADGTSLVYSTFLGGEAYDNSVDIVVDGEDNAHVVGSTYSQNFPVTTNVYQNVKDMNIGGFITRLSADGASLVTSTFIGGRDSDELMSLDIDDDGNVLAVGNTRSDDFPTTSNVAQSKRKGETDVFVTKLNSSYSNLLYSTFLGGSQNDFAASVSYNGPWFAYVAGFTYSDDFPTTSGTPQPQHGGNMDGFLSKLNLDTVVPAAVAGDDLIINQHEIAEFDGTRSHDNAGIGNWSWSFTYDGQRILRFNAKSNFTFHAAGDYSVTLTVRDFGGLEASDELTVIVRDITPPVADAGGNMKVMQHDTVLFDGRSSEDNVGIISWTWTFIYHGKVIVLHGPMSSFTFDDAGEFNITLNVSDEAGNWAIDSITILVWDVDPPDANAGDDITIDQHQSATLNGNLSRDNVGVINWTWSFAYGGVDVILFGPSPCFLFDDAGIYLVLMTVTDQAGNEATDTVMVDVRDITDPVARAGPDLVIDQYEIVTFDSSGSFDNVGIESWTWSFYQDGDIITLEGRQPEHTFETAGIYTVTLDVVDGAGNRATDEMQVTVRDITDPVPVPGEDVLINQQDIATFDGSSSSDNVGVVEWRWEFEYREEVVHLSGARTNYKFTEAGIYTVTLRVWDAARNSAMGELTVVVMDVTAPLAEAGPDIIIDQFTAVLLDGSGSTDNVGIEEWIWSFIYDGEPVSISSEKESFQFDVPGMYEISLRVVDANGNSNETILHVTVRDVVLPIVVFKGSTVVSMGEEVTFDGSGSSDNVGVVRWVWIIDDGGRTIEIEGEKVVYTFNQAGEYQVTLMVEDAEGNVASQEFVVVVEGKGFLPWLALILITVSILSAIILLTRRNRTLPDESTLPDGG